jgi:hypothetical protein
MMPDLISMEGDWADSLEQVYQCFKDTLVTQIVRFENKPVSCPFQPSDEGKHHSFWHCVTGEVNGKRVLDFRRCERVSWISWMIENAGTHQDVLVRKVSSKGRVRSLLMHPAERYLVVLEERTKYFNLVTTIHLSEARRDKHLADYRASLQANISGHQKGRSRP